MVREVDDGTSTLFWKDPCMEGPSIDVGFRRLFELANNKLATILKCLLWGWGLMVRHENGEGGCVITHM